VLISPPEEWCHRCHTARVETPISATRSLSGVPPGSLTAGRTGEVDDVWPRLQDLPLSTAFTSASTLFGVGQLGSSGQLVEIDFTAATVP
jgi:hypothetical protein